MKRQAFALIALTGAVSFLLGLVAAGSLPQGSTTRALADRPPFSDLKPLTVSVGPVVALSPAGTTVDFSSIAARLNAAVVSIDAAARGNERMPLRPSREPGDDPSGAREGAGSGFIIDATGYILTNNHVVTDADRISVTLSDGRVFKATLVGLDPAIDVALLKITTREPLPVAPLGDSAALRVGEWVCAIGNPLGYVHSVTVGVVSFLGRKIFEPTLDAYIQTDAAISFGNSGGPLINSRGQVIGITAAISAQAPNIGFAIPINQAISILPQLRERGRVVRGFIGVGPADVTPALQRALSLGPDRGALLQDVTVDAPADRAGLRPYDVVVGADGQPIRSSEDLIRYVSSRQPGTIARLEVWRDGTTRSIQVKLSERPMSRMVPPGSQGVRPATGREQGPLGLTVKDLDAATIRRLVVPDTALGVLITAVDLAGPARQARIKPNQVLIEINRRRVTSAAEFRAIVASLRPGDVVALFVYDPLSDQRTISTIVLDLQ